MKFVYIVACLFISVSHLCAEESSWGIDWEQVGEVVTQVKEEFVSEETVDAWSAKAMMVLQHALESGDWDAMREHAHYARQAEQYLRQFPSAEPWADWLVQRLDYFEYAEHEAKQHPPAPPPTRQPVVKHHQPKRPKRLPPNPHGPVIADAPRAPTAVSVSTGAKDYTYWKQKISSRPPPRNARQLAPDLKSIFRKNGVPPELIWLAEVESSFNPKAKSPVGARGLFQFMPATAEEYGLSLRPEDERLNPEQSADAASRYLHRLYDRFGDWSLALAAYNAGGGRVNSTLKKHGATRFEDIARHLPKETRMYVPKVLATIAAREGVDPYALPPSS